jgi:hypothetical protein
VTGLSSAWTQHLPPEKKKDFEALVRNSTQLLTRLKQIIEDRERELNNSNYSIDDFKDPNWSHKQAYRNGELTELKRLKEIIPF